MGQSFGTEFWDKAWQSCHETTKSVKVNTASGKAFAGIAFIKKGDGKYGLKPDDIRNLQADQEEVSIESEV